jgi:hypothetical protein
VNIEQTLREDLGRAAEAAPRAEVSVHGLELAGRREQVRRRATAAGVGAAAAVLAVVLGVLALPRPGAHPAPAPAGPSPTPRTTGGADATPRALADLPTGPVAQVPWLADGVLHVGSTRIDTDAGAVWFAGGTTVVRSGTAEAGTRLYVVAGDSLRQVAHGRGLLQPVLSPDGSLLALRTQRFEPVRQLTAYDVSRGRVVDQVHVPVDVQCCDQSGELQLLGVDLQGRVLYRASGPRPRLWTPGGGTVAVRGVPADPVAGHSWPQGLMYPTGGRSLFADPGVYGTVDEAGRFRRSGTTPTVQLGLWSPDGTEYAYLADDTGDADTKEGRDRVWIQRPGGAKDLRLRLPTELPWSVVAWEGPGEVVVRPDSGPGALVRCETATGHCEVAADGPDARAELPGQSP